VASAASVVPSFHPSFLPFPSLPSFVVRSLFVRRSIVRASLVRVRSLLCSCALVPLLVSPHCLACTHCQVDAHALTTGDRYVCMHWLDSYLLVGLMSGTQRRGVEPMVHRGIGVVVAGHIGPIAHERS